MIQPAARMVWLSGVAASQLQNSLKPAPIIASLLLLLLLLFGRHQGVTQFLTARQRDFQQEPASIAVAKRRIAEHSVIAGLQRALGPARASKDDVYRCPTGEKLEHHFTADEDGQKMRIYLTKACRTCPLKDQCTTSNERRIKRWEHEHVVEAVQTRLDQNPQAMRVRRETAEHPFATLKMRMGATHFLMKTLPKVATEMALHVLAYNLTRVMNIVGIKPLLAAIRA